ncbi:uncharacterized protein [Mytilus edulis]|uniref:uncharacterized protein isoform X1 n=2 Tax=Mytilus edulis TaxID=6550 RepID=UPI0039EF8291
MDNAKSKTTSPCRLVYSSTITEMEMKDIRSSKHGELNGGFSSPKHDHARRSFDKYLLSVDTDNANEQVLNQVTDLQKLIKEIKTKETTKMDNIEKQITEESMEIETIRMRLQSVTKSKEQPKADDRLQFREKYIMFCATERKHMCELLGSAEKTCEILKECYNHCEKLHKCNRDSMVKDNLISQKTDPRETEDISQLQKQFSGETSKSLLQKLRDNSSPSTTLSTTYSDIKKQYAETDIKGTTDIFFEKILDICWTMVAYCPPMKFHYDKCIKVDCEQKIDLNEKVSPESTKKSSQKPKKPKHQDTDHLELKYPSVMQGQCIIAKGLKQKKVFGK